MRNLKKVLTLVLTVAMLLSVMVVGTGAAFSDQDTIKNTEAVDMCVALNIINGIDGSYRPANNVTRGQMCKMICIALNGGKEPTLGTNNTPTFNDVRTNPSESWAEKFIESCYSQGIVSGVGSGRFNPGGPVTGTQAARMLLVALGYKADLAGFTGDSWAVNVNVAASNRGLYTGLENMDANAALSRDNAAQMIWNALRAYEVEYVSTLTTAPDGSLTTKNTVQDRVVGATNDKITLLQDKFNSNYFEGSLDGYTWNESKQAFEYDIGYFDEDLVHTETDATGKPVQVTGTWTDRTFTYSGDCRELFGMNVRVVYTYDIGNAKTTVFGIIPQESSVIVSGILDDITYVDANYIKVGDVRYRTDYDATSGLYATAENQLNNSHVLFADKDNLGTDLNATFAFRALDTDDNDRIDTVVYMPVYPAKVTSVGTKQITVSYHKDFSYANTATGVGATSSGTTLKFDDNTIYDGVAKDDYVLVTSSQNTAYDKNVVDKMESFTGSAAGTRSGPDKVQVDGTWYTDRNDNSLTFRLGGNYTYYNVGSFVFYADQKGAASLNDVLYVEAIASDDLSNRAKVWFYDGTSTTVTLGDVYDVDGDTKITVNNTTKGNIINKMYTYSEKDGEYTLTLIGEKSATNKNDLGYTYQNITSGTLSAATDNVAGKLAGASISDDAVVFIKYKDGSADKYKVVSGAVAKRYSDDSTVVGEMLYDTINGTKTVVLAHISMTTDLPNAKGVSGNYGYVVSAPFYSKIDGSKVIGYEIWDGKTTSVVYDEDNGTTTIVKGDVITFDNLGDGNVDKVKLAQTKTQKLTIAALAGIESDGKTFTIEGISNTYIITDNTTVLYVDSDEYAGVESGSLQTAADKTAPATGKVNNIAFVVDEADGTSTTAFKLDLLVVEVNNDWGSHVPTVPAP